MGATAGMRMMSVIAPATCQNTETAFSHAMMRDEKMFIRPDRTKMPAPSMMNVVSAFGRHMTAFWELGSAKEGGCKGYAWYRAAEHVPACRTS